MKTLVYRGGVLKFRIPESWVEKYSDRDGGMFYEDTPDSSTLRVKVITLRREAGMVPVTLAGLMELLLKRLGKAERQVQFVGTNAIIHYVEQTVDSGTRIRIFYWICVNPVSEDAGRVVTFSYTVVDAQSSTPAVVSEVEMLQAEIARTEYASSAGGF